LQDSLRDPGPNRAHETAEPLTIPPMAVTIACVAPGRRSAVGAADVLAASLPKARVEAFSLAGYLAAKRAPHRIVLCPAGLSTAADLRFLGLAVERLLWPAPPRGLRAAIGGIRPHGDPRREHAPSRSEAQRAVPGRVASALLLEGRVGASRALSALAASGPRDWIVESARHVRMPARLHRTLARAGIRWSALEPIELVALYARPALARARGKWKALLPARTRVWIAAPRRAGRASPGR
jgi:hypothetical protein